MGFGVPEPAEDDRSRRRVALHLAEIVGRDPRPLTEHRALAGYLYGTCRDFALLAVGALRGRGVPARLGAGFASYFIPGFWEDHWVCEYRAGEAWKVLDAQLGRRARAGFRIAFDVRDVPRSGWQPAASIWRAARARDLDPGICGLRAAGIAGRWWIAPSVLRDAAALAGIEALPWDVWGPGVSFRDTREVTEESAVDIDVLADAIEPASSNRRDAERVLARFPWASPSAVEVRYLEGRDSSDRRITMAVAHDFRRS